MNVDILAADGPTFASRLRRFADQLAIVTDDGDRLSYTELADRVDAFAARLGPERRLLLIEAANSVEAVVAYLASLAGGHAVILAAEVSDRLMQLFRPDAIYRATVDGWALELAPPEGGLHPDLALMLSTSGSTGATKLVRLSAGAVDANANSIARYLGIDASSRALTTLPIHYSYGLSVLNSHLAVGATVLLTGQSLLEGGVWDFFSRERGTSLAGVPYIYELLDRTGFWAREFPHLNTLTQAGGRLPAETAARVGEWARQRNVRFFIMYGQTEATARIAYLPPERLADAPDCIGVSIPGGALELRAEDGATIAATDTEGELVYRGPNVMMGYAQERADLADGAVIEALRTGDLAMRRADGLYRITGRVSRIAKPYGLRVSLDELERLLAERGTRAAVCGNDDLIAIAMTGAAPDAMTGIATELAARLKLPESLFDVSTWPELPRLPSGKPDYRRILLEAQDRRAAALSQPTGESAVLTAFRQTMKGRDVTPEASFIDMGGDSLSYVQLSMALEQALGGELPQDWERMPVSRLELLAHADGRRSWLPRIDSEMLLRAVALIAVIVNHASTYPVGGGSDALMLLAGYSLARFQSDRFIAGKGFGVVRDIFLRVMLPYLGILLLYSIVRKPVEIWNFFLLGNYFPSPSGFLTPFWFLDALFQLYLVVLALFAVPAVRRAAAVDPFRLGLYFTVGAFALKFGALLTIDPALGLDNRTAHAALPLFALGWLIWFARSPGQKWGAVAFVVALALCTAGQPAALAVWKNLPAFVGELRAVWLLVAAVLLLVVPRVPIPALLHRLVTKISATGYHIYLSHGIVIYAVVTFAPQTPLLLTITCAILLGIALNAVVASVNFKPARGA